MYDNEVEVQCRVMFPSNRRISFGVGGLSPGGFGATPFSDGRITPVEVAPEFGSANLGLPGRPGAVVGGPLLQAAAYFDPNLEIALNRATGQHNVGTRVGRAGFDPEPLTS